MSTGGLPRSAAVRIAAAVIRSELRRLRDGGIGGENPLPEPLEESRDTLALDSLERMGVATALAETFGVSEFRHDTDAANSLEDWLDGIGEDRIEQLTVQTSGSTGTPTSHRHRIEVLRDEAETFAHQFRQVKRVVSLVPADHLYGLVWTALLPAALNVAVVDAGVMRLPPLQADDLIVGVPEQWRALARLPRDWPAGVIGVNSGGPLPEDLADALLEAGLSQVFDVYGSSETSAIGIREAGEQGYALLPRWRLADEAGQSFVIDREDKAIALPDHVRPLGARRIELLGRRDQAVQIGGRNVYPQLVAARLAEHEEIAQATVRLADNGRLKAFVVPTDAAGEGLEARLRQFVCERFSSSERPTRFRFGPRLPSNDLGKPADWD